MKLRKKGFIERAKDKVHKVNDDVNQKLWGEKNESPTCCKFGNNKNERENRVMNLKKKYDSNSGKPPIAKNDSPKNLKQE